MVDQQRPEISIQFWVSSICRADAGLKNQMALTVASGHSNGSTAHLKKEGASRQVVLNRPKKLSDANSCVWAIKIAIRPIQKSKKAHSE